MNSEAANELGRAIMAILNQASSGGSQQPQVSPVISPPTAPTVSTPTPTSASTTTSSSSSSLVQAQVTAPITTSAPPPQFAPPTASLGALFSGPLMPASLRLPGQGPTGTDGTPTTPMGLGGIMGGINLGSPGGMMGMGMMMGGPGTGVTVGSTPVARRVRIAPRMAVTSTPSSSSSSASSIGGVSLVPGGISCASSGGITMTTPLVSGGQPVGGLGTFEVHVKTLGGCSQSIRVPLFIKVKDFKDSVSTQTSAPRTDMACAYKGKILSDSFFLTEYGVKDNDSIIVFTAKSAVPEPPPLPQLITPVTPNSINPPSTPAAPTPIPLSFPGFTFQISPGTPDPTIPAISLPPAETPLRLVQPIEPLPVPATPIQPLTVDPSLVSQLTDAGFSANRATRALLLNRMNPEFAMDWLLEHVDDHDESLDSPLTPESLTALLSTTAHRTTTGPFVPDPAIQQRLQEMGFSAENAEEALQATNNNYEAACNWLLSDGQDTGDDGADAAQPDLMQAILSLPAVWGSLNNPRVVDAFHAMMNDPNQASLFADDPEIGPILAQVQTFLNEHTGGTQRL